MEEKRILAIDFGEKRIGLAVTDPLNIFAYPLTTLSNDANFFIHLKEIIDRYSVKKIIVGKPLKESGEASKLSVKIDRFIDALQEKFSLPVITIDERYSSEIARQRITVTVASKKKRRAKELLDMNAAAVLLEDFLRIDKNKFDSR